MVMTVTVLDASSYENCREPVGSSMTVMPDNGCQTMDVRQWMSDNGCQTMDVRQWMSDNGCQTMDVRQWMSDNGCQTIDTR